MCRRTVTSAIAVALGLCVQVSLADVTILQNGVSPTAEYAGCTDTWISGERWEQNRDFGSRPTLRCGGKRHILIRFDLAPLAKAGEIRQAFLRFANVGYPRKRGGQWPVSMSCYRLTRAWQADANWLEHTRTDYKAADAGDWRVPGGEIDEATDFGRDAKGLIGSDVLVAGPWGHMHEIDVTAVVRRWQAGTLKDFGLLVRAPEGAPVVEVASSEWYVPTYRPALVVVHGKDNALVSLAAGPLPPKDIELHDLAATPDGGKLRGPHTILRVGQNDNCGLRGASADAYVKEAVLRFPGTWGWMTHCRVGGMAGDFSRALLAFDLRDIPKDASIEKATLHLTLVHQTARQAESYRYGAFLLALPDAPGWNAAEVTSDERRAGTPWPAGGVVGASEGKPVALGKVLHADVQVGGSKRRVNAAMEFDLTGVVRAWVQGRAPNCGIVLDNRIEGGQYDFHSARSFDPASRPYLELSVSPNVGKRFEPVAVSLAAPAGDYWVEPMRRVHGRFKGKAGTLAQYGDSITVTMAYLASFSWGRAIEPKNCPPGVKKEMDLVNGYTDRELWRTWKGGQWGNTGMMMSNWLIDNIDGWQRKMKPEVSVVMFGTNDIGRIWPPEYTESMAASLRRMMRDGTVPMLTSIPPANKHGHREYWLAALSIAHGLRVPLIDYYAEILRRRPDDWNGRLEKFAAYKGYDVPTLVCRDGTHPSNPKAYVNDFSEKALDSNGYALRNYMTLRKYHEVITKVLQP